MPAQNTPSPTTAKSAGAGQSAWKTLGAGCGCLACLFLVGTYIYFMIRNIVDKHSGRIRTEAVTVAPAGGGAGETDFDLVPVLSRHPEIYAVVDYAAMMESARKAMLEKGYGNVMGSDLVLRGQHATATVDRAAMVCIRAYTEYRWIPGNAAYAAVTPRQFCEMALADQAVQCIVINPNVSGNARSVDRGNIQVLLRRLPVQEPLPLKVMVNRGQ